ncbi:MAG: hypothetical protein KatS3mg068_2646 [Candidatus Sericytochromatia bacterium]|nr:MAG: hypothetical protein KatS3mg068_2646 [Candidatus Sericytochromatia bacterium]
MASAGQKIFCANCRHCIVVRQYESDQDKYILRVRCIKKMWSKRSGEEKLYKYFTVARRMMTHCEHYKKMGDELPFIKNLKKELPIKDEIYTVKRPVLKVPQ